MRIKDLLNNVPKRTDVADKKIKRRKKYEDSVVHYISIFIYGCMYLYIGGSFISNKWYG